MPRLDSCRSAKQYGINDSSLAPAKPNGTGVAPAEVKLLNTIHSTAISNILIPFSKMFLTSNRKFKSDYKRDKLA